jgi:lysine 6-dehydrogenase
MKVLLLGVGMQGKAALHDLVHNEHVGKVTAADRDLQGLLSHVDEKRYGAKVRVEHVDAADPDSLGRLMGEKPDVVIDLLPVQFIGSVASAAVDHRIHLVNTFYARAEVKRLADEAKAENVTILPEFGLDPGIDLVLLGEAARSLDTVEEVYSYGAGIPEPKAANNPIKYKVSWTFEGVLEAYRGAGRVLRDGRLVEIQDSELFSPENVHQVEIEGLGTLEAYPNGDPRVYADLLGTKSSGLRNMGRYTLRWPGHCAFWKTMVDLHLLDSEPVVIDGVSVSRRRFLATAIAPHIQYGPGERDIAMVRVEVVGTRGGEERRIVRQVIDWRDLETGFTAMSRTVGYTASIGAVMIGTGQITKRGVLSPVNDVPYRPLVEQLARRGIQVTEERPRAAMAPWGGGSGRA